MSGILKEIEIQKSLFNDSKNNEDEIKEHDISHIGNAININAFDSIINSGLFTNFKTVTRNHLSNLYTHVKRRNELLIYYDRSELLLFLMILLPNLF